MLNLCVVFMVVVDLKLCVINFMLIEVYYSTSRPLQDPDNNIFPFSPPMGYCFSTFYYTYFISSYENYFCFKQSFLKHTFEIRKNVIFHIYPNFICYTFLHSEDYYLPFIVVLVWELWLLLPYIYSESLVFGLIFGKIHLVGKLKLIIFPFF